MGVFVNGKGKIKKGAIWLTALAGVIVILAGVYFAFRPVPFRGSRSAYGMMTFRAVAAQDPDPKTRNPDYLAVKFCNLANMRERMGLSLDFRKAVETINQRKWWVYYYATTRTKHFDALLLNELKAGVKQVVIMGAGFDTRAYRFHKEYPKVKFFEVDLPAMSEIKKRMVRDISAEFPANVVFAPIDFNTQDLGQVLASLGYQKNLKTLFLWEGVTMYLDAPAVASTLRFIAQGSAPGSSVVFDYTLPSVVQGTYDKEPYAKALAAVARKKNNEPFTFGIEPSKSGGYLKKQGLEQVSNIGPDYMVKNYMTGSNGKPLGTHPGFFWITQAKVPGT